MRYTITIARPKAKIRSEEHTSELQSHSDIVCRLLLEKKKKDHPRFTVHEGFADRNSLQRPEFLNFKKFIIRKCLKVRTEVRVAFSLDKRNGLHKQIIV